MEQQILKEFERWYELQCNGEWEHAYGVQIETLDNPGWAVTIDLSNTVFENITMDKVNINNEKHDWLICEIKEKQFLGYGDATKLQEILKRFLQIINGENGVKS